MIKPRLNLPLAGFKKARTNEANALVKDTQLIHYEAPECSALYGYAKEGQLIAVEFVQLGAVSEWWIKENN
ncbi:hypothetical protein [Grimontia sp. NTOU-MAR1]|uniref:hypothetical protein n=1 Tax=Grimontia sp. NTOU-MAR1 TaxID=3111011 RepID=UPI002DBEC8C2|nr:hypothetical protein [Grimontia sp. NTOU-MAR1]WRV98549.1 hypothetical protein VP504_03680 [Grimontia sp. NTOU-MAR1]